MVSKAFILMAVIAYVEARFGQEQVPISAISSVQGGSAGAAATIAGAAISDLLGAANSCAKLTRADQIFTELGGGADALAAAIGMVTAEKNTNPFANGNVQNVCGDPALPVTPELRGITPLIDPAVDVNGAAAALSKSSAASPLAADGLSVFDLMDQAGLGDLVKSQASAGGAGGAAAGGAGAGNGNANGNANNNQGAAGNGNANNNNQNNNGNADNAAGNNNAGNNNAGNQGGQCNQNAGNQNAGNANNNAGNAGNANNNAGNANNSAGNANNNAGNANNNAGNANNNAGNAGNAGNANNNAGNAGNANGNAGAGGAAAGGADFGQCTPTITFQGGENGRPATEFTFQIADPLARGGQGEALNPDIITNALCNQLTNVCGANAAAIATCESAKAAVKGGPRNKSTADKFNTLIGFPGAVTNPDGGPADVAAKRVMRRGLRM